MLPKSAARVCTGCTQRLHACISLSASPDAMLQGLQLRVMVRFAYCRLDMVSVGNPGWLGSAMRAVAQPAEPADTFLVGEGCNLPCFK